MLSRIVTEKNLSALAVFTKLEKNALVVFHGEFWNHITATKNAFFFLGVDGRRKQKW